MIFVGLFLAFGAQAQEDEWDGDEWDGAAAEEEGLPLNTFIRFSPSSFLIHSVPAQIDFKLLDDDFFQPDSITDFSATNSLQTYGLSLDIAQLVGNNYIWSVNTYIGWADYFQFFNYIGQIGIGKEFQLGNVFLQPTASLGFVTTSYRIGQYNDFSKGYFELNNQFIISDLVAKFKSNAFSLSPALSVELPLSEHLFLFAKGSLFLTFNRRSFIRVSGETDEFDSDGNRITAYEKIHLSDGQLELLINNRAITSKQSPYLHYNMNSVLLQLGFSFGFSSL